VLLRLGHEGQGEVVQELAGFGKVCALGIQISLEGVGAGLIDGGQSLQVGVDVVDAKVDVEFKLKPLGSFFGVEEVLCRLSEELLSISLIEGLQDMILVGFVSGGVLVGLDFRF
jgi:hypothetical protein